jgi:hypothetical protein
MKKQILAIAGLVLASMIPMSAYSQVQVGVGIGLPPEPVCQYGFYPDYPYTCAPYGYYDDAWFDNGIFIGAGPWFHYRAGYGRPESYYRGWHSNHPGEHGEAHHWDNHVVNRGNGGFNRGGARPNAGHSAGHEGGRGGERGR